MLHTPEFEEALVLAAYVYLLLVNSAVALSASFIMAWDIDMSCLLRFLYSLAKHLSAWTARLSNRREVY